MVARPAWFPALPAGEEDPVQQMEDEFQMQVQSFGRLRGVQAPPSADAHHSRRRPSPWSQLQLIANWQPEVPNFGTTAMQGDDDDATADDEFEEEEEEVARQAAPAREGPGFVTLPSGWQEDDEEDDFLDDELVTD